MIAQTREQPVRDIEWNWPTIAVAILFGGWFLFALIREMWRGKRRK